MTTKKKSGFQNPQAAADAAYEAAAESEGAASNSVPAGNAPAQPPEESGASAQPSSQTQTDEEAPLNLFEELKKAQAEALKNREGWLYAQAEFTNYRKRIERDREQWRQDAVGSAVKRYLPVVDDLERALKNIPDSLNGVAWVGGVELIYQKMLAALEADGVAPFGVAGEVFDPNLHEAIAQAPSDEYASGHIVEVLQKGYKIGEKVLRPALVRVAA